MINRIKILLILICLLPHISSSEESDKEYESQSETKSLDLFSEVFYRIKNDYVEKSDDKKVIESAINGMLYSLDPHSSYLDSKALEEMKSQIEGSFGGIGTELFFENGLIKIMTVIEDTPASKSGLKNGDYIVKINDQHIGNFTYSEAARKIRGKKGSVVNLTILREHEKEPLEFKITRDIINNISVKSRLIGEDIAYIKISIFGEKTTDEVKKSFKQLKDKANVNLKGVILDLRNNPGGSFDQSIEVSNLFLDKGEIVSTKGRNKENVVHYRAKNMSLTKLPIIVLINQGSASAAEIVAGALQDHKRAIIMGTTSFGKGTVQTLMPLPGNNGAIKITTARYYTPSGKSIQAEGIKPDINVEQIELKPALSNMKKNIFKEANYHNHLAKEEMVEELSSKVTKNLEKTILSDENKSTNILDDYQLSRAVDMLNVINNLGLVREK